MKKEILIISNYFPPESGAASNRIYSLAKKLSDNSYDVSVICPLPNYPEGRVYDDYRGLFSKKEFIGNIVIKRLFIYASNSSNKFLRLLSSLSFAIVLFQYILFNNVPKKVIIQGSPLIVGFIAVLSCRIKSRKIILNVSDLWPLAGLEMGILNKGFYYNILLTLETYIYKNSDIIVGQSNEILNHVSNTISIKNKILFLYRNFPDFEALSVKKKNNKNYKIVYAGLLGLAQGIESICNEIDFPKDTEFHIYGNGPKESEIDKICKSKSQIFYHGSLKREKLHSVLQDYDATLIPLKNRIYGSVPSKIFEYSKLGLPIIYFSDGEGAELVSNLNLGISIRKANYKELQRVLEQINNGDVKLPSKQKVLNISFREFDLEKQFQNFENQVLSHQ
jgi:glycosyltransferase involved in cell wall biosynthesis